MDSVTAFNKGQASKGKEPMVFDWFKAVKLILEFKATNASAGLQDDWNWTGGDILVNGNPLKENESCYLSSTWAIPEICIDDTYYECYAMQSKVPEWNSSTFWPKEALELLPPIYEVKALEHNEGE